MFLDQSPEIVVIRPGEVFQLPFPARHILNRFGNVLAKRFQLLLCGLGAVDLGAVRGVLVVAFAPGWLSLFQLDQVASIEPEKGLVTKNSVRKPPPSGVGRKRRPFVCQSVFLALVVLLLYNASMRTDVLFESNRNVVYSCKYHVVWCPKYRRPVLVNDVGKRLREIIFQTVVELNAKVIELEVMSDHVHLLCEVDPQFGVHGLVKQLKGRSSRVLRAEFPWLKSHLPSLWTNSYFVATVGGAPLAVIKRYIEQQKRQ